MQVQQPSHSPHHDYYLFPKLEINFRGAILERGRY